MRRARSLERRPHALEVDGVQEDDGDAVFDELFDLLRLPFHGERRVAREQDVAVILDDGADLLVDDLVERVVERHVDGAELPPVLVLSEAEVMGRRAEHGEGGDDGEDSEQQGEEALFAGAQERARSIVEHRFTSFGRMVGCRNVWYLLP